MAIKKGFPNYLTWILTIFYSLSANAQVDPGVEFDLQGFVDQKIKAGESNIVIPPGRYRVDAHNNSAHLYFEDLADITVIAEGVEMICTQTVQAIQINNCTNFTLKGLTVDYDPLPFTQARIIDLSGDKRTITAEIIEGYSTDVKGDKLEIYDPVTGVLTTTTYYGVSYEVDKETRLIVISKNYGLDVSNEELGDILVLDSEFGRSRPHIVRPDRCTGLVLEEVTLYSGPTFGFLETDCSGSQYINCRIDRRPISTDIRYRGVRRMRSINADGFHSKHASVGPKYVGCIARYNGDDGIAINGHYHIIESTDGNIINVVPKGGNALNLSVGDTAELVSYTGERNEDAIITSITKGPAPSGTVKTFLQNQTFHGAADKTYTASNVYIVTVDRSVNLPMGSLIASANRIGNGFEVRNCTMGPNRSRGILVKASNGIITGNRLVSNWGQAIKLAPEFSWLEAGSGSNVTVSNNIITGCNDAGIAVYANGGNGETAPAGAHQNITISGNSISGSANPGIAVTSTTHLKLNYNTIEAPNNDLLVPWRMNSFGRKEDLSRKIYLENVQVEENNDLLIHFRFDEDPDATELINSGTESNVTGELDTSGGTITPGASDPEEGRVLYVNTTSNGEILLKDSEGNYTGPTVGTARTYAFWLNPGALQASTLLYCGSEGPDGPHFTIQMEASGILSLTDDAGNKVKTSETLIAEHWHNIVLTLPENANIHDAQFYINGEASGQTAEGPNAPVNSAVELIRLLPGFVGYISDFRYYNSVLTAEEIQYLYNGSEVDGVSLNANSGLLSPNQTTHLTAKINPVVAHNPALTWSTSDATVAVVDENGLVTAVAEGTAIITVATHEGGFTDTCALTVVTRVTDISLSKSSASLAPAETIQLTSTVLPESSLDLSVTWSSNNPSVASVDTTGLVTAIADGTATITVTTNDRELSAKCEITVYAIVTGVRVSPESLTLEIFESAQLIANVTPTNASNTAVSWSSDNPSVAQVTESGTVKGYSNGTATITATTDEGNYTADCEVTVGTGVIISNHTFETISIYPNPTQGILNITIDKYDEDSDVSIMDLAGKALICESLTSDENRIDLSSLNEGIYHVILSSGEQIIYRKKIFKVNQ